MKVVATRETDAPLGPVCANWAYRTYMPAELNYRCAALRDESVTVNDRDMGGYGNGTSTLSRFRCALFDVSLSHENGIGPFKCSACLAQTSPVDPKDQP